MEKCEPNDIAQVIANTSGHSFKINQLIRLSEMIDDEIPYWKAISFDGNEYSRIPERDFKYYTAEIDPIDPAITTSIDETDQINIVY